jgi:hypothetical protein
MSSIAVAKLIASPNEFAGRKWFYDFKELQHVFKESICKENVSSLTQQYSRITKGWSVDTNSEWICRIYFAAKMVLNSTLQLMNLEFAKDKNLRIVIPYLKYYAALSSCRSVVLTLPNVLWEYGKIFEMTHSKTINITFDYLANYDKKFSEDLKRKVLLLKAGRELIAYRAPSSGDFGLDYDFDVESLCRILVELAQFNSELLESSILKNASQEKFEFKFEYIDQLSRIKIGDIDFRDREDRYRLDYLRRKWPVPPNIRHIMTEGHTEDFFGAWDPEEESNEAFSTGSPCDWQAIFDIP